MERSNIFSVNLNSEKLIDHEEFIVRRESAELSEERKRLYDKRFNSAMATPTKVKAVFRYLTVVCVYLGITEILDYINDDGFSFWTVLGATIGLSVCVIFQVIGRLFEKKKASKDDALSKEFEDLARLTENELNIPSSAKEVDVFVYLYDENGQVNEAYENEAVKVFEERGKLCIHFLRAVIGIPIESIESVEFMDYPIEFLEWNKKAAYDSEEYEAAEISYDGHYTYMMENYYSIYFSSEGNSYELMVPSYDIKPFLDIVKLEVKGEIV